MNIGEQKTNFYSGVVRNENSTKDFDYFDRNISNSVHSLGYSSINKRERTTPGRAGMDRVAGRGSDNFIRWCHRCKREIPFYLDTKVCEWCGGKTIKILNESEDKQ